MGKDTSKNIRTGVFVLSGTAFLIIALYAIGNKQNLFGSTFRLNARFHNVNGLMSGNNVRLAGINVGTVESVEIVNDSTVNVLMLIEKRVRMHIKNNALATVGTEGLMGNKIINITNVPADAPAVEDGDLLAMLRPLNTDDMLRTLNITNNNIKDITGDLKRLTDKLDNSNTLWGLLTDTAVADNIKNAIVHIRVTGERTAIIAGDLSQIMKETRQGKGLVGALLTDTSFSAQLRQSIVNITMITDSMALVSGDLRSISSNAKNGKGAIGTLLMDTTFVTNLNKSILHIKNSAKGFDDNMEALKHSIFLRRYFKKQEKARQQGQQ